MKTSAIKKDKLTKKILANFRKNRVRYMKITAKLFALDDDINSRNDRQNIEFRSIYLGNCIKYLYILLTVYWQFTFKFHHELYKR